MEVSFVLYVCSNDDMVDVVQYHIFSLLSEKVAVKAPDATISTEQNPCTTTAPCVCQGKCSLSQLYLSSSYVYDAGGK